MNKQQSFGCLLFVAIVSAIVSFNLFPSYQLTLNRITQQYEYVLPFEEADVVNMSVYAKYEYLENIFLLIVRWNNVIKQNLVKDLWDNNEDLKPKAKRIHTELFVAIISSYSEKSLKYRALIRKTWLPELLSTGVSDLLFQESN